MTTPGRYRPFAGGYVSEAEQFLNDLLRAHPDWKEDQRRGWYKLWDKKVDLDELAKAREDMMPAKPYQYD